MGELQKSELNDFVEEVIKELKNRIYPIQNQKPFLQYRILILGELQEAEKRHLEPFSQLLFSPDEGTWDMLVAAQLKAETMARAALCIGGDAAACCILQSLQQGGQVWFLERGLEYRKFRGLSHKSLYQKYGEYEKQLLNVGCRTILDIGEIKAREGILPKGEKDVVEITGNVLDLTGTKVLRESDLGKVRGMCCGTVFIDQGAILTPLAQDFITSQNLIVKRQ